MAAASFQFHPRSVVRAARVAPRHAPKEGADGGSQRRPFRPFLFVSRGACHEAHRNPEHRQHRANLGHESISESVAQACRKRVSQAETDQILVHGSRTRIFIHFTHVFAVIFGKPI